MKNANDRKVIDYLTYFLDMLTFIFIEPTIREKLGLFKKKEELALEKEQAKIQSKPLKENLRN